MARTPIHPGKILAGELDAIAAELARVIDVPANRISQIVAGRRNVTADTALRLGRYFGTSADLWINLQKTCEFDRARAEIGPAVEHTPAKAGKRAPGAPSPR